ncbi:amino acid adenylation domain-containing protein [Photobacterium frigidiphilum]|uniref:non-ribosomal peptide synthetase n=1 Tax=Photobacterium frigidiphilum TaxID=264736 RepID=UPI003D13E765
MSLIELLSALKLAGCKLEVEGGQLRVKGKLPNELRSEILAHKPELLSLLGGGSKPVLTAGSREERAIFGVHNGQRGLWFISQQEGAEAAYVEPGYRYYLKGELNIPVLEQAFSLLVDRHEIIRTTYHFEDNQLWQHIEPAAGLSIQIDDLCDFSLNERREKEQAILAAEAGQPFDLANDLMLRVRLIRFSDDEYMLLMVMHHIAMDGWSWRILTRELETAYNALVQGNPLSLPPAVFQYSDYVAWRQKAQFEQEVAPSKAYWQQQLAGAPALHRLPLDYPRTPTMSYSSETHSLTLSLSQTQALNKLARDNDVTLYTVLQGIFSVVLSRYSGEKDIVVGSPFAGRNHVDFESMVGLFVNTLALRMRWQGDPCFTDWLKQVNQIIKEADQHQNLPFDVLVDSLQIDRSNAYAPIFQVMLVLLNMDIPALKLNGVEQQAIELPVYTNTKYDLSLICFEHEQRLTLNFEYNTALFKSATIAQMAEHVHQAMYSVLDNPSQSLSTINLFSEEELSLLVSGAQSESIVNPAWCLHQKFENQVKNTPDLPALTYRDKTLTYCELNCLANRLASQLVDRGVSKEAPVGLCLDRTPALIIAVLASLKAGGCYVSVDPSYPEDRQQFILTDSGCRVLLTEAAYAETFKSTDCTMLLSEDLTLTESAENEEEKNPDLSCDPAQLSHLIYTSGSTGKPKGVMVEHRNVAALMDWTAKNYSQEELSRVLFSTSLNFDLSVYEIWAPLLNGGTILLVDDISELVERDDLFPTLINTVPSALEALISAQAIPDSVKTLNVAGEPLSKKRVNGAFAASKINRIYNLYGPSEDTTYSTYALMEGPIDVEPVIGTPISYTRAYVLDSDMALVPEGAIGELYLSGHGVTRGYLNRPELTDSSFFANPYAKAGHERLYKTGDLVSRKQGDLVYFGRRDNQVKVRGFRIELGEIEAVMGCLSVIQDQAVIKDDKSNGNLIAYVTLANQADHVEVTEQIRYALAAQLPDYMIPAQIRVLMTMPMTVNGKIDRQALRSMVYQDEAENSELMLLIQPETPREQQLLDLWLSVLPTKKLAINSNFFRVGGDSILAIQLVAKARRDGLKLSSTFIFEHQTIAEQARNVELIDDKVEQKKWLPATGTQRLTPMMRAFFENDSESIDHYNQSMLFAVPNQTKAQWLSVLVTIWQRHDVFRIFFDSGFETASYRSFNLDRVSDSFHELDLRGVDEREAVAKLAETVKKLHSSLSVQNGELSRCLLIKRKDGDQLLWIMHHLIVDGVSWRILEEELQILCLNEDHEESLLPLRSEFSLQQWAEVLHDPAFAQHRQHEISYWQSELAIPAELPVEGNKKASEATTEYVTVRLPAEQTGQLLQSANDPYNTRPYELMLAALVNVLSEWSDQAKFRIELEGHGRDVTGYDVEQTMGWFTSIYPVGLTKMPTSADQIIAVKEKLRAIPDNGLGYGALHFLHQLLDLRQEAQNADVVFNYLGQFSNTGGKLNTSLAGDHIASARIRQHKLGINALVQNGELLVRFDFSTLNFASGLVARHANDFMRHLTVILEHCASASPIHTRSDFPLSALSADEFSAVIQPISELSDVYPVTPTQQGMLFHAIANPDAAMYNNVLVLSLTQLEEKRLKESWQFLVERHSILRTVFVALESQLAHQVVYTSPSIDWLQLDWRSETDPITRLQEWITQARQSPFVPDSAPLMRFTLIRLRNDDWRLVWQFHHSLLDGWSISLLLDELKAIYSGNKPLAPVPALFKHYVAWQREQDAESAKKYWQTRLAGISGSSRLLPEHSIINRSKDISEKANLSVQLEKALTQELTSFAAKHSTTLNVILQAAWGLLASKYSNSDNIIFGQTVSGRTADIEGIETIVGPCITTIPVRLSIPDTHTTLSDWLKSIQMNLRQDEDYSYIGLRDIQACSSVNTGLFDSLLVFENFPSGRADNDEIESDELIISNITAKEQNNFPISLIIFPGESLKIHLDVDTDYLSVPQAEALLSHFVSLIKNMLKDGKQPVSALSMLTEDEHDSLVHQAVHLDPSVAPTGCIHQQFEQMAVKQPDSVALIHEGVTISYQSLNRRANRLARTLIQTGVKPDQLVGLHVSRSFDMVVGILGILKAGGAYVPLDPNYPEQRRQFIEQDAQLSWIVTDSEIATQAQVISIIQHEDHPEDDLNPDIVSLDSSNLAYVIYTSGSTGNPKGVMVEHRNVVRLFTAANQDFSFSKQDVWTLFHSYAFDFSVWELWGALAYGGQLVIVSYEQSRSPDLFFDLICQQGVTVLNQTPSAFYNLSKVAVNRGRKTTLRYVVFGGEALDFSALADWFTCYGDTQPQLVNMYGITETTVHVTYQAISQADSEQPCSVIGRPLPDLFAYVCDAHLNILPVGVPGELIVGGEGVTRGYLHRRELTESRFIDDPHQPGGGTVYCSGDLVRQLADGNLEYLGRIDQQVKIRGFRIELGEIESCLRQYPQVSQAAVIVVSSENGHKRLVAFVEAVSERNSEFDPELLGQYLSEHMPEYMVPSAIHQVEAIQLTSNGKVNRQALLSLEIQQADRVVVHPQTEQEHVLADVAVQVLGLKAISMTDSFFTVGGDSIIALQLIGQLAERGYQLTVSELFTANHFAAIARCMQTVGLQAHIPNYHPFSLLNQAKKPDALMALDDVVDAYPAAAMQEGMVYQHQMETHSDLYHDVFAYQLSLPWQPEAFRHALQTMVERHELLRSGFWLDPEEGQFIQLVYGNAEPVIKVTDWQQLASDEIQGALEKEITEERSQPFDVNTRTLIRMGIYLLEDDSFVFMVTFSHAILDGWSLSKFNTELSQIYQSKLNQQRWTWQGNQLPYHVFITQELASRQDISAREFWQESLREASVSELPTASGSEGKANYFSHELTVLLPQLKQLANQLKVPLQHVLLAGHFKVLSLMTGETDVMSCVVSNGRPAMSGSENSLGLFLNTLPLRHQLMPGSWNELIQNISDMANHSSAHRLYPLADIQQYTGLKLDQILFNFTHFHSYDQLAENSDVRLSYLAKYEASEFSWVAQFMLVEKETLVLELQYGEHETNHKYAKELEACYQRVFSGMAERAADVHMGVYDAEGCRQQLALITGGTDENDQQKGLLTLPKLYEQQVLRSADQTAVISGQQSLTYQALNQRANVLAHYLLAEGVREGDLVGILLDRSVDMVVALLGVMKAGAAYVPLDPAFPEDRLSGVLDDAGCVIVITNEAVNRELQPLLKSINTKVCLLNKRWNQPIHAEHEENLGITIAEDNPAYVIYTSGSTGKPKGVLIEHGALSNFISAVKVRYDVQETDHTLSLTTISFDIAILELFLPLISGATCVLATREERLQGKAVQQLIEDHDIRIMQATPTGYQLLQDSGQWFGTPGLKLLCGGEALPVALAEKLLQTGGRLWNQYGPTEATVWVTAAEVTEEDLNCENGYVPISGWLANCGAVILNPLGEVVPAGVAGELYLSGSNLARGYHERPSLTQTSFVVHKFSDLPARRWYKTGDQVRLEHSGKITYLSRLDHQVKIRGHRIELGEIESVINQYPGIQACTVIADGVDVNQKLLAYIVTHDLEHSEREFADQLRSFLMPLLPDYMLPADIHRLTRLPLTPNGKVDRKALPRMTPSQDLVAVSYETEAEHQLADIWQEVLSLDSLPCAESDFFHLGGHSLLVVKMVVKVRAKLGVELPLNIVFKHRILRDIASEIKRSGAMVRPALVKVDSLAPRRASYAQQRMWFIEQLPNGKGSYNMPLHFILEGELDVERLEKAIVRKVERFTSLRSVFVATDAEPVIALLSAERFTLQIEDISHLDVTERAFISQKRQQEMAVEPFDLELDYMLRAKLLILGEEKYQLLLTMHHIASDGWSWGIFLDELSKDYNNVSGQPLVLTELAYDMVDYAAVQKEWLDTEKEVLQEYWTEHLEGIPALHSLPTDYPRPAVQSYKGRYQHFRLSSALTEKLSAVCIEQNITLFMLLQSAFSVLLSRYSGEKDIVMGTPVAGRDYDELEHQIGLFVNTLVVRTDLSGDPTVAQLFADSRDRITTSMAYQDVPFEWLVDRLRPERSTSHTPLFQVMFALQSMRADTLSLNNVQSKELWPEEGISRFDLSLYCREENGEIGAFFEYASALFNDSTITGMAENYENLLWSIVQSVDEPVSKLALLSDHQKQEMLTQWNKTDKDYDTSKLIHHWFEMQAEQQPHAVALVFGDQSLTYDALNQRANQLAHYLLEQVAEPGPDSLVGVCLPRSLDMVISLLAILKAGMAYVPIDPSYPQARISYMLGDSQVSLVLTHTGILDFEAHRKDVLLDAVADTLSSFPQINPAVSVNLDDLAYVIYTSGSTGNPKGVMVEHGAILNRLMWMQDAYALSAQDRILQKTPFSFDVSVWEFFWPLMFGARLVVAKPDGHKDGAYLADLIIRENITVLHFVPSMLQLFVDEPLFSQCQSIRYVFCSGEALPFELQQRFYAINGNAELHNLYGPTEAAVDVTWWGCQRESTESRVPIGRPIANMQVVVLDEQKMPVPVNVSGELYLAGVGLARGYLNKPELTEAAFIPSPFNDVGRLYKTGDKVRWLVDGTLEYMGRLDHQIKLRGFRIELGEIESVLYQMESIREVVVLLDESLSSPALVAYLVPNQGEELLTEAVRGYLRARLPEHLVPSYFVVVEYMPLTPNGKLDRKALPNPHIHVRTEFSSPQTETEAWLSVQWELLLSVNSSTEQRFFEVGGNSLLALRLVNQIKQRYPNLVLSVQMIFEHQTITTQAAALDALLEDLGVSDSNLEGVDDLIVMDEEI